MRDGGRAKKEVRSLARCGSGGTGVSVNVPQRRVLLIPGEVEGDERRPGGSYAASLLLNQVHEPL